MRTHTISVVRAFALALFAVPASAAEPLPSWNDTAAKRSIVAFVEKVTTKTQYKLRDGKPVIVRLPEVDFIDDKEGKPVGINSHIGRRPIFAAGNSDGDWQMLQYTTIGRSPSFGLIVHHTDAEREWAYDRDSHIGELDKALDDAPRRGWAVVDMKRDWSRIYQGE